MTDLLGIDPAVYRQINAALASGKRHIMLYGPPGTGKTTLARHIATVLTGGRWTLVTGSSDWSSQDIIGGYQPVGDGSVAFIPGVLLRRFDRPFIIDELNRCDIDKVIGPLFSVLSGQQTTLPYRLNIEDKDSLQYVILPESKPSARRARVCAGAVLAVGGDNQLHRQGRALPDVVCARAAVRLGLCRCSVRHGGLYRSVFAQGRDRVGRTCGRRPLPSWRVLGGDQHGAGDRACAGHRRDHRPCRKWKRGAEFFAEPSSSMKEALLDAVDMVLLPMLDGIVIRDAELLADKAIAVFGLNAAQTARIKARMRSVAV